MTEREYIDATNLAKVRAAKNIVRDVHTVSPAEEEEQYAALQALSRMELRLQKRVETIG